MLFQKCIFQLTEEEKGEWVAAAVAKESWIVGSGAHSANEEDNGSGKKEEDDEVGACCGGWKQNSFFSTVLVFSFCFF